MDGHPVYDTIRRHMSESEPRDIFPSARGGRAGLIGQNAEGEFIRVEGNEVRVELDVMFDRNEETVIDKESLRIIQVEDLHKAVDHTITAVGSAELYRSLIQPPAEAALVWAKQESAEELHRNGRLRQAITDYLHEYQAGEIALFKLINERIDRRFPYGDFKAAAGAGVTIFNAVDAIPTPQTRYLRQLVDTIKGYGESPVYRLMRGPIYRTFSGLRSKEDVHLFTPKLRFRPTRFTAATVVPSVPLVALFGGSAAGFLSPELTSTLFERNPAAGTILISMSVMGPYWTLIYGGMMKPIQDYFTVIEPLRNRVVDDGPFVGAVDAVGQLDELQSFLELSRSYPYETTVPQIIDGQRYSFRARNLRNPVLAAAQRDFVPNSVSLDEQRMTFITGPNSGGKTTICKSIFQNQLLGQIGCRVLASEASMSVADRMAYQAPRFDALQDAEGRFGTELRRTKDIFFSTTPRSLIIFDELAEGTTREEKLTVSHDILNGFLRIGNVTILVTHNHELVSHYADQRSGQFLQVEFMGREPTFRLISGISTVSHADEIAKRVSFSAEDIERHLRERGYQ